jgi:hypothetical protein
MSRSMDDRARLAWVAAVAALAMSACGQPLYLGSDIIWSARHEDGDLSEWLGDPESFVIPEDAAAARVVDAHARTGRYGLSLTRPPTGADEGPRLGHAAGLPVEAYYAAWLYVAEDYPIETYWAILQFRSIASSLPAASDEQETEIRLRRLPGGELVLYVFQHDADYLQAPLADPPAIVPVAQWFQIEIFYRHVDDLSGKVRVWLDGRLVYDLADRRTGPGSAWFGVASISADRGSTALRLFADDVSISWSRATPDEWLARP